MAAILRCCLLLAALAGLLLGNAAALPHHGPAKHDYRDALTKSILFFEGQRSGRLPPSQRVSWRRSSGLSDGSSVKASAAGRSCCVSPALRCVQWLTCWLAVFRWT